MSNQPSNSNYCNPCLNRLPDLQPPSHSLPTPCLSPSNPPCSPWLALVAIVVTPISYFMIGLSPDAGIFFFHCALADLFQVLFPAAAVAGAGAHCGFIER